MNLHITEKDHLILQKSVALQLEIGSYMYGMETSESDKDILCFRSDFAADDFMSQMGVFSPLLLQYKDVENNIDYVYTSRSQFFSTLLSGDSQINLEVALFELEASVNSVKSFKILRGLLGVAKRDLHEAFRRSPIDNKKLFFAYKMYSLAKLIYESSPDTVLTKDVVVKMKEELTALIEEKTENQIFNELADKINEFRVKITSDFDKDLLFNYPPDFIGNFIEEADDDNDPTTLILRNLNTKTFKYD